MKELNFKDIDLSSTCFEELSNFFETQKLEQLGREVKFIERSTSRLSAWMFLQLNTCLINNGKTDSLNDLGTELFKNFGVQLTKQSLDERFNIHGVTLMRKCFESVFEKILSSNITQKCFTCGFKRKPSINPIFQYLYRFTTFVKNKYILMTKETEMRKHYDNFLVSGLTRKVYCEKHNINIHTFKYWQCKLAAKTKSSFLTVEIPKKSEAMASILQLEIQYPNGVKIKSGLDFEIIRQLISLI